MNQKLKDVIPINRFVAVTIVLVDYENNIVEVWNGGNPPIFAINENNEMVKRFESMHLALGILPDESFDTKTEFLACEGNNNIVLYSDGLIESENAKGEIFDEYMLLDVLKTNGSAEQLRNNVAEAVSGHLNGEAAHDDMSLVVINTQITENN